jgi:hypothetical protein
MAEAKQIGLGTLIKLDSSGGGVFVTQPLVMSATPPPRVREEIDAVGITDTLDVPALGIEQRSYFEFAQFWHPGETEHAKIETMFATNVEGAIQIVTPHATPKTLEFDCKVTKIEPESLDASGMYKRKVTFVRTSAITLT